VITLVEPLPPMHPLPASDCKYPASHHPTKNQGVSPGSPSAYSRDDDKKSVRDNQTQKTSSRKSSVQGARETTLQGRD
jgi:hypothetical protein